MEDLETPQAPRLVMSDDVGTPLPGSLETRNVNGRGKTKVIVAFVVGAIGVTALAIGIMLSFGNSDAEVKAEQPSLQVIDQTPREAAEARLAELEVEK